MSIGNLIRRLRRDSTVQKKYVKSGTIFGDAVSYLYMGECERFEELLSKWELWETEYTDRSYRTVSIDRFVKLGGYGKSVGDVIGKKRESREEPIFHAQIYRDNFLGKYQSVIDIGRMEQDRQPQFITYAAPSTEIFPKNNPN